MPEFTLEQVEEYLNRLYEQQPDPIRHEMEALARRRHFPIIGPLAGRHLYQLARMVQARRIFEMGSGFGYSALFFARAVGPAGQVHCTELSAENISLAEQFLSRANLWPRITYHHQEATAALQQVGGRWDIIYNDIDKQDYPSTIELAYNHLEPGGLFITDNIFWHGRPFQPEQTADTQGVVEFTHQLLAHQGFMTTIYPVRDGVAVALRR